MEHVTQKLTRHNRLAQKQHVCFSCRSSKEKRWTQRCLCIKYRKRNYVIIKDRFPIPLIELLEQLRETAMFSNLDLKTRYHQIRMHSAEIYKTDLNLAGSLQVLGNAT